MNKNMSKHPLTPVMAEAGKYRGKRNPFKDSFSSLSEERHHTLMGFIAVFTIMVLASACSSGGGGGGGGNATPTYTIGGTVSGLSGTVVLQNNDTNLLPIVSDGTFTFIPPLADRTTYTVTVKTQPAGQTCSVVNGVGVISGADVGTVTVTCSEFTYTVSGTVSGLSGTVVLQNNDTDLLTIVSDGTFTFIPPLADGTTYTVTVKTQPAGQTCSIVKGTGALSGADVTDVTVTCQDALAWDAPVSDIDGSIVAGVAGYKIYYGTEPGVYTGSIDVGNTTRYAIAAFSAIVPQGTYYISVTAYDADRTTESACSNEIARIIN